MSASLSTALLFDNEGFSNTPTTATYETAIKTDKTLTALPAANTGTLSTRTDNDTGVCTLSTGHNIVSSGAKVDVDWAAGVRYGMTATVATNDVTVDGGAGDNLPTQSTAVTVCQQTAIDVNFDGDLCEFIAVLLVNASDTGEVHVDFQDSGPATIKEIDLVELTANGGLVKLSNVWDINNGDTNAFTGNRVVAAYASHDSSSASTLRIRVGHNST